MTDLPEPQTVEPKPGLECWISERHDVKQVRVEKKHGNDWICLRLQTMFNNWLFIESGPFYKTERDARIAEYLKAKQRADEALRYAETLLERLNAE